MELGLLKAKYLDHDARVALYGDVGREETQKLQELSPDGSQWGEWPLAVHAARVQRDRQFRAYEIMKNEGSAIQQRSNDWYIHNYSVTLSACECPDFQDRKLPCKHIYTAALASSIALSLTENDYNSFSKEMRFLDGQ
jgi:hypothetical protein